MGAPSSLGDLLSAIKSTSLGGGSGAFTPNADPFLSKWFDAADFNATPDGTAVVTWNDKGPSATNATNATSAQRPTVAANALNGNAALLFNTKNLGFGSSHVLSRSQPFAVYVVLQHLVNESTQIMLCLNDDVNAPNSCYFTYTNVGGAYQFFGPSGWANPKAAFSPTFNAGHFHLVEFIYNGLGAGTIGNFSIYADTNLLTTASGGGNDFGTNDVIGSFQVGTANVQNNVNAKICEIIVSLGITTRLNYETYFSTKYGTLPS